MSTRSGGGGGGVRSGQVKAKGALSKQNKGYGW